MTRRSRKAKSTSSWQIGSAMCRSEVSSRLRYAICFKRHLPIVGYVEKESAKVFKFTWRLLWPVSCPFVPVVFGSFAWPGGPFLGVFFFGSVRVAVLCLGPCLSPLHIYQILSVKIL